jgi:hypothetical protein
MQQEILSQVLDSVGRVALGTDDDTIFGGIGRRPTLPRPGFAFSPRETRFIHTPEDNP